MHTPVRGTYPTDEWKADQYIRDDLDLYLTSADKDGEYRILVGVEVAESADAPNVPCSRVHTSVETAHLALVE